MNIVIYYGIFGTECSDHCKQHMSCSVVFRYYAQKLIPSYIMYQMTG